MTRSLSSRFPSLLDSFSDHFRARVAWRQIDPRTRVRISEIAVPLLGWFGKRLQVFGDAISIEVELKVSV